MASHDDEKIVLRVGEKLRRAREHAKLTQAAVAAEAGMHVNYYARMERGEVTPSFESLQKIMKVLGIKTLNITTE